MLRYIKEFKACLERMMDANIHTVHRLLDTFELIILKKLAPTIDITIFHTELASLHSCVDAF